MWIIGLLHANHLLYSGFFLAIYRFASLKYSICSKEECWSLLRKVLVLQWIVVLILSSVTVIGGSLSGTNMTWTFAKGVSFKFSLILAEYQMKNGWYNIGITLVKAMTSFALMSILSELFLYMAIFRFLKQNDLRIASSLTKETLNFRKRRNVMTLSGQVFCFAVETFTLICGNLMINSVLEHPLLHPSMYPALLIFGSTLESLGKFFSSPDLRQHYLRI